jgi:hypothetical protein
VQVVPIKPTLKPPGTKRLKLIYDKLLSRCAFKFILRRYNEGGLKFRLDDSEDGRSVAGANTPPLFSSTSAVSGTNHTQSTP